MEGMTRLLDQFNRFFKGSAHVVVRDEVLEITVGTQTLRIALPEVTGGESKGSS